MRFTDARKAIHDSFALHLTTPDGIGGGTKYDSDAAIFRATKAGLIIAAVLDQPKELRGCAMLLNAPDQAVQGNDIADFKTGLWCAWTERSSSGAKEHASIIAQLDKIIMGYRARCWDHTSKKFTVDSIFSESNPKTRTLLTKRAKEITEVIAKMDSESLQPVWAVIQDQKDKYHAATDREAEGNILLDAGLS